MNNINNNVNNTAKKDVRVELVDLFLKGEGQEKKYEELLIPLLEKELRFNSNFPKSAAIRQQRLYDTFSLALLYFTKGVWVASNPKGDILSQFPQFHDYFAKLLKQYPAAKYFNNHHEILMYIQRLRENLDNYKKENNKEKQKIIEKIESYYQHALTDSPENQEILKKLMLDTSDGKNLRDAYIFIRDEAIRLNGQDKLSEFDQKIGACIETINIDFLRRQLIEKFINKKIGKLATSQTTQPDISKNILYRLHNLDDETLHTISPEKIIKSIQERIENIVKGNTNNDELIHEIQKIENEEIKNSFDTDFQEEFWNLIAENWFVWLQEGKKERKNLDKTITKLEKGSSQIEKDLWQLLRHIASMAKKIQDNKETDYEISFHQKEN